MKYATQHAQSSRYLGWVLGMFLLAGLGASPARGGTIIPPRDLGELARLSEAVVLAQAGASYAEARGGFIYTYTPFEVLDVVSGAVQQSVVVETYGGVLGDQGWAVGGSPEFAEGNVYLLFLNRRGDVWQPRMLAYGLLERLVASDGSTVLNHIGEHHDLTLLPRPDGVTPEPIGTYFEAPLLDHLRQVVTGRLVWDQARVAVPEALRPPAHTAGKTQVIPEPCVYLSFGGYPIRWNTFDGGDPVEVFAEENGDAEVGGDTSIVAVENSLPPWNDVAEVNLDLRWSGPAPYTPDCDDGSATPDDALPDQTLVQYNDPCNQMPDLVICIGPLAFGGMFFNHGSLGRHLFRNMEWNTAAVGYVVVNNGAAACTTADEYEIMMTHEIGHTLGFDHIPPSAGVANMNPVCCNDLTEIDETCTQFAYSDVFFPTVPAPIVLRTPPFGAVDQPVTLDFTWDADTSATSYHLQVDLDDNFAEPVFDDDQLTEATHQVDSLRYETEYFWRVRGQNAIGFGLWSEIFRLETMEAPFPPDSVMLVAPADSAINQPTTLTFEWEMTALANTYHLQVSLDSVFSDLVFDNDRLTRVTREVDDLDELTTYYWRVRAANNTGVGPWSEVRSLTTVPPLPDLVTPIAPAQDVVGVPPTLELSWQAVPLTDHYHLQVATAFNFSGLVYSVDTLTTTTRQIGPLEARRKYFWRVRGINAAGPGPWMDRRRFTTGQPPGVIALIAPGDSVIDQPSTIRFQWQTDAQANTYHLQVSTDSTFSQLIYDNDQLTQTSQELGPLAYLTTHFWRVRGINAAGPGPWSDERRLTIAIGTAVEDVGEAIPEHFALHPNYPNPFNPQTTLHFDLPEAVPVSLVIYDLLGRAVETLVDADLAPGQYRFVWDATDRPSGLYLVRLHAGVFKQTRKITLLK